MLTLSKGPFVFPIFMRIFQGTIDKNYNGALEKLKARLQG